MKKIKMTVLTAFASISLAWAQVPDSVQSRFQRDHSDVENSQWTIDGDRYTATYRDTSNMQNEVMYDRSGNITNTRRSVRSADYPGSISNYYKKNYPGEENFELWMEEDNRGRKSYTSSMNENRLYFDEKGNYLRSEKSTGINQNSKNRMPDNR